MFTPNDDVTLAFKRTESVVLLQPTHLILWQPRHTTFFPIGFAKKPAQFKYDEKHKQGPNENTQMETVNVFLLVSKQ